MTQPLLCPRIMMLRRCKLCAHCRCPTLALAAHILTNLETSFALPLQDIEAMQVVRTLQVPYTTFCCAYVRVGKSERLAVTGAKGGAMLLEMNAPGKRPMPFAAGFGYNVRGVTSEMRETRDRKTEGYGVKNVVNLKGLGARKAKVEGSYTRLFEQGQCILSPVTAYCR